MKFRSVFTNYKFNVIPEEIEKDNLGRMIRRHKGLYLFFGLNHLADTEAAQREHNWTDEERLQVERAIMGHDQFKRPKVFDQGGDQGVQLGDATGFVLYFAPGQDIPEEHKEFVQTCRWYQIAQQLEAQGRAERTPTIRCAAILPTPNGDMPCPQWADEGSEYCGMHTPIAAEVS